MNYFYMPASGQVIAYTDLLRQTGFSPSTPPEVLAANGIYPILTSTNPYDPNLYTSTATYTVAGSYANQSWTATPLPLATARGNSIVKVKERANSTTEIILATNSVTSDVLASVASQDPIDRPSSLQAILDETTVVTDNLGDQIDAINAATAVDEINSIVNPPSGTITFHRSGSNLIDGLFRDASASDPNALTLSEGWVPDQFTLRLVSSDITVPYVLPEGFKETAGGLGSGTQSVELKVGSVLIATFSLTTGTEDKIFTF